MRKAVFVPSKVIHCRSSRTFCTAKNEGGDQLCPQLFEVLVVKFTSRSMLCRPEKTSGAQPVLGSTELATAMSESPPPVPSSNFRSAGLKEIDPSGFLIWSMYQKLLPVPAGAETYAAVLPSNELRMEGSA